MLSATEAHVDIAGACMYWACLLQMLRLPAGLRDQRLAAPEPRGTHLVLLDGCRFTQQRLESGSL